MRVREFWKSRLLPNHRSEKAVECSEKQETNKEVGLGFLSPNGGLWE